MRTFRRVMGTLCFLTFFLILGTVGAIEQDMVTLGRGTVYGFLEIVLFYVTGRLSGAMV